MLKTFLFLLTLQKNSSRFVVERRGLRSGLMLGAWLTMAGGALCCLSTLPGLLGYQFAWWDTRAAFTLTVIGQALTGMACPFISCVPTKVRDKNKYIKWVKGQLQGV